MWSIDRPTMEKTTYSTKCDFCGKKLVLSVDPPDCRSPYERFIQERNWGYLFWPVVGSFSCITFFILIFWSDIADKNLNFDLPSIAFMIALPCIIILGIYSISKFADRFSLILGIRSDNSPGYKLMDGFGISQNHTIEEVQIAKDKFGNTDNSLLTCELKGNKRIFFGGCNE